MRARWVGLLVAVLLSAYFLVESAFFGVVPRAAAPSPAPLAEFWPLLVPALVPLALVFVLVLLNLDDSPPAPSRGDLDRLVGRKQHGALPRPRRLREARPPAGRPADVAPLLPVPPEDVLGQLVRQKRRGAWEPGPPGWSR